MVISPCGFKDVRGRLWMRGCPPLLHRCFRIVMAGLVPAIHDLTEGTKNVDARDKPGHDDLRAIYLSENKPPSTVHGVVFAVFAEPPVEPVRFRSAFGRRR